MQEKYSHWLELGVITLTVGFFVLVTYYLFFELRWCKREREMNEIIDSLGRDPQMYICADKTKATLDTKVGEFRRVVFS